MESKLPDVPMAFNYAGRLFLIQKAGHKISAKADEPFSCGFCRKHYGEQERYSTLQAQAEDGTQVSFIFCGSCVQKATEDFPEIQQPKVERALAAKIEHDGATQRDM